jgi:hypothetical protein
MTRLAVVLASGVALGVIGRLSDGWPDDLRVLFALGSPWVAVAVLVGASEPGRRRAAVAAAAALLLSVVVYYVVMAGVERRVGPVYATAMIAGWGGLAVVVGAVFGAAGSALRAPAAAPAAALIGGALAGEALLFLAHGSSATALLLGQLALGLTIAIGFAPPERRARLFALTAAIAGASFVIDAAARLAMRRYGWGG